MASLYNLFISHSWAYSNAYDRLIMMLSNRSYFRYRNYSVPRSSPLHTAPTSRALYNAIKEQMQSASVVVVLAGVYSTYSPWIQNEIKIAKKEFWQPKPVLGVIQWGAQRSSAFVQDSADLVVKWNTESIVAAIRDLAG